MGTPHGAATSTPHGASASNPNGATTSTQPATTTTRLNTIKPIPGQPVAPAFDIPYTYAEPDAPTVTDAYGRVEGVCSGAPPKTELTVHWETYNTDFVELDRGSDNRPANGVDYHVVAQCSDPGLFSQPVAEVLLTAFGPGGEVSDTVEIYVDPNYRP